MTRSACVRKLRKIKQDYNNGERSGVFINKIFFFFNEWDVEILRDGILVHNDEQGIIDYRSLYIMFDEIIEMK